MIEQLKVKLGEEVERLQHELNVTLPQEIRRAVEMGDLRENSEYKAALERQQLVQARLGQLRQRLSKLSQIDVSQIPSDKVGLGSHVVVAGREDRRARELQPGVRRFGRVRGRPRQHVVADRENAGGAKRWRDGRAQAPGIDAPAQNHRAQDDPRRGLTSAPRASARARRLPVQFHLKFRRTARLPRFTAPLQSFTVETGGER